MKGVKKLFQKKLTANQFNIFNKNLVNTQSDGTANS